MNEIEVCGAQGVAIACAPTAFGAESDGDGRGEIFQGGERARGLVVIEGEAAGGGGESGEDFVESAAVSDAREAGVEGLLGAGDEVPPPFAGRPEGTLRVVEIAFFRGDEIDRFNAEGGEVAQDVARGLRAREADDHGEGSRRRGIVRGSEGERERLGGDGGEGDFAAWAVDESGVEGVADLALQDFQKMAGARIGARKRAGEFGGLEEDEVQDDRRMCVMESCTEMTAAKSAAGAGFQIKLECCCAAFIGKGVVADKIPGAVFGGVRGLAGIVIGEAGAKIAGAAYVVLARVVRGFEEVDVVHPGSERSGPPSRDALRRARIGFRCVERVDGIEPTIPLWKRGVLPLNYTRGTRLAGPGVLAGGIAGQAPFSPGDSYPVFTESERKWDCRCRPWAFACSTWL